MTKDLTFDFYERLGCFAGNLLAQHVLLEHGQLALELLTALVNPRSQLTSQSLKYIIHLMDRDKNAYGHMKSICLGSCTYRSGLNRR